MEMERPTENVGQSDGRGGHCCCCSGGENVGRESDILSRNSNNNINHCKYELGGSEKLHYHHPFEKVCQNKCNVNNNANSHKKYQQHASLLRAENYHSRGNVVTCVTINAPNNTSNCKCKCCKHSHCICYHHNNELSDNVSKNSHAKACVYNDSICPALQQRKEHEYWTVKWTMLVCLVLLNIWEVCFILFLLHPYSKITATAA